MSEELIEKISKALFEPVILPAGCPSIETRILANIESMYQELAKSSMLEFESSMDLMRSEQKLKLLENLFAKADLKTWISTGDFAAAEEFTNNVNAALFEQTADTPVPDTDPEYEGCGPSGTDTWVCNDCGWLFRECTCEGSNNG